MLKVKHGPTFWADVKVPLPGGGEEAVRFEFVHKTKDDLDDFLKAETWKGKTDVENVMAIAKGWEGADQPFGPEALAEVFQNYQGAPAAIVATYIEELTKARLGN